MSLSCYVNVTIQVPTMSRSSKIKMLALNNSIHDDAPQKQTPTVYNLLYATPIHYF